MATAAPEGTATTPRRRAIVDALVLAFSHSRLNKVVGTDAFRSVLDAEYRTLTRDGVFDLGPVWDLLEGQPGFDAEQAGPPMCRFKSWESLLGIPVTLPAQLKDLPPNKQTELAEQCGVPTQALKLALRGDDAKESLDTSGERSGASKSMPAARAARTTKAMEPVAASRGSKTTGMPAVAATPNARRRRIILAAAATVAVLGFGFGGFTLYQSCRGPEWQAFSAREISAAGVPASKAQRIGKQVAISLSDESWLGAPEDGRRTQLTEALRKLQRQGVAVLIVRDRSNAVRATAQFIGESSDVKVAFR
jgi:hypothetical protein